MPHLRFDHTTNDWVVFAPLRKLRPHHNGDAPAPPAEAKAAGRSTCPFCPGHEDLTPQEIAADRLSGAVRSDWRVRVVPNKFPALRIEEEPQRLDDGPMFWSMGGCGAHEVVIESPDHDLVLARQPLEQVERVLGMVQRRYRDLMNDRRFQAFALFKNHGEGAGTSLQHPHWQIIATPVVPRMLRAKHAAAMEYFDRAGRCLYAELIREELAAGTRVVARNERFVAFVPYAAHLPFETWIAPLPAGEHCPASEPFHAASADTIRALADLLQNVLRRIYVGLDNPDFNLTIDLPPRNDEDQQYFLWHLRILPRLSTPAGFEMGSGMSINTVMPEDAAAFLRPGNGGS